MFAKRRKAQRSSVSKTPKFFRPGFEALEQRIVPADTVPPYFILNASCDTDT